MKKLILFFSIILAGIYITNFISAINMTLGPDNIMPRQARVDLSSVTGKVDVSGSDIKLNGKLYVTGKICDSSGKCLGECGDGETWDSVTSSCKADKVFTRVVANDWTPSSNITVTDNNVASIETPQAAAYLKQKFSGEFEIHWTHPGTYGVNSTFFVLFKDSLLGTFSSGIYTGNFHTLDKTNIFDVYLQYLKAEFPGQGASPIKDNFVEGDKIVVKRDSSNLITMSVNGTTIASKTLAGNLYLMWGSYIYSASAMNDFKYRIPTPKKGSSASNPGESCSDILATEAGSADGLYWIDLDGVGTGSAAFQAYCDMTTDGGGWTMVMNLDTNDGNVQYYDSTYWTDLNNGYGNISNNFTADYKSKGGFNLAGNQLLIKVHEEGTNKAWKSYNLAQSNKSLGYYFNAGDSIKLTNGKIAENNLSNLNAKEPTIKQGSDLYLNTSRGLTGVNADKDRISIGGAGSDDHGGGLGTFYDVGLANYGYRPRADAQLLNCWWNSGSISSNGQACRIGDDHLTGFSYWNQPSGLQYDYAFFIKTGISKKGSSADNPGESCSDILATEADSADGLYWIDPDGVGTGNAAFEAYCDMTTDGGGWTLVGYSNAKANLFKNLYENGGTRNPLTRNNSATKDSREIVKKSTQYLLTYDGTTNHTGNANSYDNVVSVKIPNPSVVDFGQSGNGNCITMTDSDYSVIKGHTFSGIKYVYEKLLGATYLSWSLYGFSHSTGCSNFGYESFLFQREGAVADYPWVAGGSGGWQVEGSVGFWLRKLKKGTSGNPGLSCKDILDDGSSTGDGLYWIDPDGVGTGDAAFQAYCDMTTDGGGWTLVLEHHASTQAAVINKDTVIGTAGLGNEHKVNMSKMHGSEVRFDASRTESSGQMCIFKKSYNYDLRSSNDIVPHPDVHSGWSLLQKGCDDTNRSRYAIGESITWENISADVMNFQNNMFFFFWRDNDSWDDVKNSWGNNFGSNSGDYYYSSYNASGSSYNTPWHSEKFRLWFR